MEPDERKRLAESLRGARAHLDEVLANLEKGAK
jgi:hypothetical protein